MPVRVSFCACEIAAPAQAMFVSQPPTSKVIGNLMCNDAALRAMAVGREATIRYDNKIIAK